MGSLFLPNLECNEDILIRLCEYLLGLVVFTILVDSVLHWLEHRLVQGYPGLWGATLAKLYKEVMIVGLISYALLIFKEFDHGKLLKHEEEIVLELAHSEIFFISLAFVLHAPIFFYMGRAAFRNWNHMGATGHAEASAADAADAADAKTSRFERLVVPCTRAPKLQCFALRVVSSLQWQEQKEPDNICSSFDSETRMPTCMICAVLHFYPHLPPWPSAMLFCCSVVLLFYCSAPLPVLPSAM